MFLSYFGGELVLNPEQDSKEAAL